MCVFVCIRLAETTTAPIKNIIIYLLESGIFQCFFPALSVCFSFCCERVVVVVVAVVVIIIVVIVIVAFFLVIFINCELDIVFDIVVDGM